MATGTENSPMNRLYEILKSSPTLWGKMICTKVYHYQNGMGMIKDVVFRLEKIYIGVQYGSDNEGKDLKLYNPERFFDGRTFQLEYDVALSDIYKPLTGEQIREEGKKQEILLQESQKQKEEYLLRKKREERANIEEAVRQEEIRFQKAKKQNEERLQEAKRRQEEILREARIRIAEREANISNPPFRRKLSSEAHLKVLLELLQRQQKPQPEEFLRDELFTLLSVGLSISLWAIIPDVLIQEEKYDPLAPPKDRVRWLLRKLTGNDLETDSLIISRIAKILAKIPAGQRKSMLPDDSELWGKYPDLLGLLPDEEKILFIWNWPENEIKAFWPNLSLRGRILFIFRAAVEKRSLEFLAGLEKNKLIASALLIHDGDDPQNRRFERAHNLFQDFVIGQAWDNTDPIDLHGYLPLCRMGIVAYCEVKPWRDDEDQHRSDGRVSRTFCPRYKQACEFIRPEDVNQRFSGPVKQKEGPYGARLYPEPSLDWRNWSLLELIEATHVKTAIPGQIFTEYVQKLGGWVNRLNEIRERLKCSVCGELMRPDMEYPRSLARYMVTRVSCRHGMGHDQNIYLNHCWACREIIDSRESSIRHENYYLCIHCGSGLQRSPTYTQGDICPKCGKANCMAMDPAHQRSMTCSECGHTIRLPAENDISGDKSKRSANFAGKWKRSSSSVPEFDDFALDGNIPPPPDEDWFIGANPQGERNDLPEQQDSLF